MSHVSGGNVLLLNADYRPIRVIPWERAFTLLLDEKVWMVHEYEDRMLRSASDVFAWPSVIAHKDFHKVRTKVRFSRSNVLARDQYECVYCGNAPKNRSMGPLLTELTIDHVVPRAQSTAGFVHLPWNGRRVPVTSWENCVTACRHCNLIKADRLPSVVGFKMKKIPSSPKPVEAVILSLAKHEIPSDWKAYLPKDSEWAEYWDVELSPE